MDEEPTSDIVYSDEDSIASDGRRGEPFFKPDWSPDLLLSTNYLERFGIFRKALVEEAGAFIADCGRGETYDLVLRVSERTPADSACAEDPLPLSPVFLSTTTDAILSRRAASRDEAASSLAHSPDAAVPVGPIRSFYTHRTALLCHPI